MLLDHRSYKIKPGHVTAHLDIYEKHGYEAQTRHLGKPLLYMLGESGEVNSVVHVWAYEDAADRMKRRSAMMADPQWLTYLRHLNESGLLLDQRTNLMIPAKFAPITK